MRATIAVIAVFLFICSLLGCLQIAKTIPDAGVWYCDELQVSVDLNGGDKCYILIGKEKLKVGFRNDRGSKYVTIESQEIGNESFPLSKIILEGECVSFDEKTMTICEEETGRLYTFYRQE